MFNFLSGMMGKGGGMMRGLGGGNGAAGGGGGMFGRLRQGMQDPRFQQALGGGGGMFGRLRQGMQDPRFQQALGGAGAQLAGMDPNLGAGMVQGVQNRRLQQGFDRSIQPIAREKMPVQIPRLQPDASMPWRKPMAMPQGALGGAPGAESLGGGAWTDPRLLEMLRGRNLQRY